MLLPKSYAGSLQVALSTQTTTHTAQQPLNGLRTALKKNKPQRKRCVLRRAGGKV